MEIDQLPRYRDVDVRAFPVLGWFSDNCRALREAYDMRQAQFAQLCGVTQAYYSSIECLKANPKIEIVGMIAAHTGISVSDLVSQTPHIDRLLFSPRPYVKGAVTRVFAENCTVLRASMDLSQEKFSTLCHITQAYYSTIENLKATPTLEIVSTIALHTKTTPALLIGGRVEGAASSNTFGVSEKA